MNEVDARRRLDGHYEGYRRNSPQDSLMRRLVVRTMAPFFSGGAALELGCSDGAMTELLAQHFSRIDVVEGSVRFIEEARRRGIPGTTYHHTLFDEFEAQSSYDAIIASYVLTHVPDDVGLLQRMRSLLRPGGRLFAVVPNVRVLSRQLAVRMGYLPTLRTLSENDRDHGHVRAYDQRGLHRALMTAGYSVMASGGILLKPLADFQMDALIENGVLGPAQLEGLYSLGREYPELCSAVYAVCAAGTAA